MDLEKLTKKVNKKIVISSLGAIIGLYSLTDLPSSEAFAQENNGQSYAQMIIQDWKELTTSSGNHLNVKDINLKFDDKSCNYYHPEPGCDFRSIKDISIILKPTYKNLYDTQIPLPNSMEEKLISYFTNDMDNSSDHIDCYIFAHHMNNIPYHKHPTEPGKWIFDLNNWIIKKTDIPTKIGDTIIISKRDTPDENGFMHWAIYIGKDVVEDKYLYISKFGPEDKLIITTLSEMKKEFGDYVFKAVPK